MASLLSLGFEILFFLICSIRCRQLLHTGHCRPLTVLSTVKVELEHFDLGARFKDGLVMWGMMVNRTRMIVCGCQTADGETMPPTQIVMIQIDLFIVGGAEGLFFVETFTQQIRMGWDFFMTE